MKNKRNLLSLVLAAIFVIGGSLFARGADLRVSGTVVGPDAEPLIGASVQVKGLQIAAVTDIDGQFSFECPQGSTIVISYVGYKTKELKAAPSMDITLEEDGELLNEVVVIGYGSVKRKDVTTAISSVSSKDFENRPIISAAQAIQGKAAGVAVTSPNGAPGGEMSIRVRGTTSFNGSNDPQYIVDGVPVDNIKFLSPTDIENIQILKDASAAAIYGSRAANGVVLITTKAGSAENAKVTLNLQGGFTRVANKIDVLNAQQYKELQDEIGIVRIPDGLTDRTDWFDETYRTGSTQSYQVAVSQSSEKMKYYLSGGYAREQGILNTSYYQRYSFRANVEGKIKSWLTLKANIVYADYSGNGGGSMGTGSNRGGVILAVVNTPTYAPIWDPDKPGSTTTTSTVRPI